jgi:hypothetical protein
MKKSYCTPNCADKQGKRRHGMGELSLKILDKLLSVWLFFLGKRKKSAGDAYVGFSEINQIIKGWVRFQPFFGFERVYMLRSHNGVAGKRLMPGGFKYISALAGDARTPFKDMLGRLPEYPAGQGGH